MRKMLMAAAMMASLLPAVSSFAEETGLVEKLPRTEELEGGQTTLPALSKRQLTALLLDLLHRQSYDREQHAGVATHDGDYLQTWVDRVTSEMSARGMSADDHGDIVHPAD